MKNEAGMVNLTELVALGPKGYNSIIEICGRLIKERDQLAAQVNQLTERSVGAMVIAEGENGWEWVPADCPMLDAVKALRQQNYALAAQVARLREALTIIGNIPIGEYAVPADFDVLSESPPEALLQLKREWIGPTAHLIPLWMNWLKSHNSLRKDMQDELTRLTTILDWK